MDDAGELRFVDRIGVKQREVARHAEQAEADHQHSRDRAALECDLQRLIEADARRLGGAHVGADRDIHADDAAGARQQRADEEAPGRRPAERGDEADHEEQDHADDGDGLVLPPQVSDRALAHCGGDLAHALVAVGEAQDARALPDAVNDGCQRAAEREQESPGHVSLPLKGPKFYQVKAAKARAVTSFTAPRPEILRYFGARGSPEAAHLP